MNRKRHSLSYTWYAANVFSSVSAAALLNIANRFVPLLSQQSLRAYYQTAEFDGTMNLWTAALALTPMYFHNRKFSRKVSLDKGKFKMKSVFNTSLKTNFSWKCYFWKFVVTCGDGAIVSNVWRPRGGGGLFAGHYMAWLCQKLCDRHVNVSQRISVTF